MSIRRLTGIHAVREALRAGTPLRFVAISRERHDPRVQELAAMARAAGVPVRRVGAAELAHWSAGEGGHAQHQGVAAEAEAKAVLSLEDLLADAPHKLLLALDGLEDPHNLGAIVRSACGAGVDGLLLPARRSVGLTTTVERVSAGALEYVRVARVGNLAQALENCQVGGWWIVGLDAQAATPVWRHDFRAPTVLVIGAEGRGLHALIRRRCDALVRIPLAAGVSALNASAAAAVVLFEAVRQRSE